MDGTWAQGFSMGLTTGAVLAVVVMFLLMVLAKAWEQRQ